MELLLVRGYGRGRLLECIVEVYSSVVVQLDIEQSIVAIASYKGRDNYLIFQPTTTINQPKMEKVANVRTKQYSALSHVSETEDWSPIQVQSS